ncbi:hypothetical protein [Paraclostridium sordellii]|uniref:hypothetical protein n=1 Tax=Paraclostridium sordellii TaxID=1505 RepID=UPI0005E075B0|nr:hypothetical protein [Paeniclostridium sordellii]CEO20935.1 Uncharacterised protein [[Clostridium] sordellii] [Paeniclostridium sordellii]
MAQVKTYKPSTVKMTAASTKLYNGESAQLATDVLSNWNRLIVFSKVRGASGTALPNTGIRVYQLLTAGASLTSSNLISTIFTDAQGEYGISLQVLSGSQAYAFETFSAGN